MRYRLIAKAPDGFRPRPPSGGIRTQKRGSAGRRALLAGQSKRNCLNSCSISLFSRFDLLTGVVLADIVHPTLLRASQGVPCFHFLL